MNCNPINPNPSYSCTSHLHTNQSPSNFFEKRMRKEKDKQIYFSYVFHNGKKNRSEIFSTKKTRNILFYYFQIYLKCNGYLFNIVLLISSIITTQHKGSIIIALILFNEKNNFDTLQKIHILGHFLTKKIGVLGYVYKILLLVIYYIKFLLVYDHIYTYQLYMDMVLFYRSSKYNSNKKIEKIHNNLKKFLQNTKTTQFSVVKRCNTSDNIIIIARTDRGMLIYFLKFFIMAVSLFVFNFLFFVEKVVCLECSIVEWNFPSVFETVLAQGYHVLFVLD